MMHNKSQQTTLKDNQEGLVAIIVTMMIMIILSLIVMGFSRLAQREQRQSLDRQLHTQAYYAAESGVNDASQILTAFPDIGPHNSCNDSSDARWNPINPGSATTKTNLVSGGSVQYTCVLVTNDVQEIIFDSVDADSKVIPLNSGGAGGNFNAITFQWQNSDSSVAADVSDCDSSGGAIDDSLPVASAWGCSVGMMRVDLVPTPSAGFDRNYLLNNLMTVFLYPSSSGSNTYNYTNAASDQGAIVATNCTTSTPAICTMTINVGSLGLSNYMARVRSDYQESKLVITSTGRTFRGAQAIIDATGRAADVVRRIQVRKSIGTITSPLLADYTIESNDICKRYTFLPGASGYVTPGECQIN